MMGCQTPSLGVSDGEVEADACTTGGSGGGLLLRRLMMKTIGMAIAAGMPASTAMIIMMTMRSGPARFIKLATGAFI
jgi:hypothetical protein